jgi:ubiquinone/menaquinone biosynthesis C-methylase UbiE
MFVGMLGHIRGHVRILDAGGTAVTWQRHIHELSAQCHVTVLNKEFSERPERPDISYIVGDARDLRMFPDRTFDICFSNSLIEHVRVMDQAAIANEIRRVARGYFVQTPNRYFLVEPHFLVPGWQFLPVSLRAWLLQKRDFGWMKKTSDPALARKSVESIRLLDEMELRKLFSDGEIHREKVGPFTKSLIACRPIE